MQIATIAGNVGKDAEFKTTQSGDPFCRFSVAVSTGWGDKKSTTWWDVTRWGKGADKLAEFVTKGSKVSVMGELSTREHEGKTYLQIRADHVALQGGGSDGGSARGSSGASQPSQQQQNKAGGGGGMQRDDLDDDVPFATMGITAAEVRTWPVQP